MDKQALINYISKLNDRNLQKKKVSGFTTWAILGVFAYLLFDFAEKIPIIYNSSEFRLYLLIILAGLVNFSVLLFLLIISITNITKSFNLRRFSSQIDKNTSILFFIPTCFVLLVFAFINFKAANYSQILEISPSIFWIFSIYFTLNGISPIFLGLNRYRKSKKSKTTYPELSSFSFKMKVMISIIWSIISLLGFYLLFVAYRDFSIPLNDVIISLLLKISIEIIVFLALIMVFFENVKSSNKDNWLENLELEIYLNDLTESEIREKLESEYFGVNIIKWIEKRNNELNAKATEFLKLLDEEKQEIEEILQSEMIKNFDDILIPSGEKLNDYHHICNETIFQMEEIIKQGFLEKEEEIQIKKITIEWRSQLNDLVNKSDEFWNYIKEIRHCDNCNSCSINRCHYNRTDRDD